MTPNERRYTIIGWIWIAGLTAYVIAGLFATLMVPFVIPFVGTAILVVCTISTLIVDSADRLRLLAVLAAQSALTWLTLHSIQSDGSAWPLPALGRGSLLFGLPLPFVAGAFAILGSRRRAHASVGTT